MSVSLGLLAAVVVVVAMALNDDPSAATDMSSAPVLLNNMAELSKMAKDATDAMISSDEKARTTDLASGSLLKPMVNPFPNWKFNVFDPDLRDKPHHRWTKYCPTLVS